MGIADYRKYIAEMVGTMVLVLFGCGVAVVVGNFLVLGSGYTAWVIATALAFGLSIVAMAYVIGNISGCHINPAVSLGMYVNGKMELKDMIFYMVFQIIGGLVGAALLFAILGQLDGYTITSLGQNGFDGASALKITMLGAIIVEIILTFVFMLTILGVTSSEKTGAQAGLVIGLTLTFVHLIGIPLTGTSVNPARSIGPAIMMTMTDVANNGLALEQVWVFIVAPFIGAILAALLWKTVLSTEE